MHQILSMFSRWMRSVFHLLLIATLLDATGGYWMALQSVAWTKMVFDYSRESSLKTALSKTFDGAHPCELCKSIQKARQNEGKRDKSNLNLKREVFCQLDKSIFLPKRPADPLKPSSEFHRGERSLPPLLTPPRLLSA